MFIEDKAFSAAASSREALKLNAFASFTANSPSLISGCSIGGRFVDDALAFTTWASGIKIRLAARNIRNDLLNFNSSRTGELFVNGRPVEILCIQCGYHSILKMISPISLVYKFACTMVI